VQGWEAVGRLRVSAGLEVDRYAGAFFRRTESDMDFPALHADHSFAIQLRHDSSLSPQRPALLQYALVYSTAAGQRRIRCAAPPPHGTPTACHLPLTTGSPRNSLLSKDLVGYHLLLCF